MIMCSLFSGDGLVWMRLWWVRMMLWLMVRFSLLLLLVWLCEFFIWQKCLNSSVYLLVGMFGVVFFMISCILVGMCVVCMCMWFLVWVQCNVFFSRLVSICCRCCLLLDICSGVVGRFFFSVSFVVEKCMCMLLSLLCSSVVRFSGVKWQVRLLDWVIDRLCRLLINLFSWWILFCRVLRLVWFSGWMLFLMVFSLV